MANRRMNIMDIREMIRMMRLGKSNRQIANLLGVNRKTVNKYAAFAQRQDLLQGELPSVARLNEMVEAEFPTPPTEENASSLEPHRKTVIQLREQKVEVAAIHQRLVSEHGYQGSYSAVWRFVKKLEPSEPEAVVRVETEPGEQAQVDFGYAGKMIDPRTSQKRKTWAFVMTLSWSRHQYVEFVFDQKVETWLRCHRNAFEFFRGVPGQVVVDNLKAAILRACWEDPVVQRAYRELAEHYGFLIAPCRPRKPEHKGKVEQGGVHYVARNFLAGRQDLRQEEANRAVRRWIRTVAGERIHGTTRQKPLRRFETVEQTRLHPLPAVPYDPGVWKQVKLHRDCHVVFENAYYSAPHTRIGERMWVRGNQRDVRIYTQDHELVAVHSRVAPGERQTLLDHLPSEKVAGMILNRENAQQQADDIGPAVSQVVKTLLDHRPEDRLRTAGRLLKLAEKYTPERLEAACERALHFSDPTYTTIKRILEQAQDGHPIPQRAAAPPATAFLRSAQEFARNLIGGQAWN